MNQDELTKTFAEYVLPYKDHAPLGERVLAVLNALPAEVIDDFVSDPRFQMSLDNFEPGRGSQVWMACPGTHGESSRSVVLKRRLAECSVAFAKYVIGHEFAHAYLRNEGWGEITDPEQAADALAEKWGFARPSSMM